jgi:hypothetical protein
MSCGLEFIESRPYEMYSHDKTQVNRFHLKHGQEYCMDNNNIPLRVKDKDAE